MFQSLLSPIRSRFEIVKSQNGNSGEAEDPRSTPHDSLTSTQGPSLLSPRSPMAWGVTSPALSVFGVQPIPASSGTDQQDLANAEEFARDVLVEIMRGLLEDMRSRVSDIGKGVSQGDVQVQIKVRLRQ